MDNFSSNNERNSEKYQNDIYKHENMILREENEMLRMSVYFDGQDISSLEDYSSKNKD